MAIAILLAPLVIAAAQVLFIRTLGKIYNIVAAGDPAAPVFPLRTLNYFTTAFVVSSALLRDSHVTCAVVFFEM